tara:strand:+ start:325 stop:570 length:246 start_codon:yes stop_codon:yes gene_type:complete
MHSLQVHLGLQVDQRDQMQDLPHQQVVYLVVLAPQQEDQMEHFHQQLYQDLLEQLTLEAIQEEAQHLDQPLDQHLAQPQVA